MRHNRRRRSRGRRWRGSWRRRLWRGRRGFYRRLGLALAVRHRELPGGVGLGAAFDVRLIPLLDATSAKFPNVRKIMERIELTAVRSREGRRRLCSLCLREHGRCFLRGGGNRENARGEECGGGKWNGEAHRELPLGNRYFRNSLSECPARGGVVLFPGLLS